MAFLTFGVPPVTRHDRRRLWPRVVFALISMMTVLVCTPGAADAAAQTPSVSEYQVKAAFLYNFAKYVEWPAESFSGDHAPLVLGIVGEDPFGSLLDQIAVGKTVLGRRLTIKRLKRSQDLRACHMLFISSSEREHLPQIMGQLKGACVLTIGEMKHFTEQGGVINFITEDSKVHFEINVDTAERTRLKMSAKLLMLAKIVRDASQAKGK